MKDLNLKTILNEIGESASVSKYLPKQEFDKFQASLEKITEQLKTEIKAKVVGRQVAFRGAKGFGQIEQTHSAVISDVDIVLYQDKYTILFKGSEGKSKKQNEYYIDPTSNVYMKIGNSAPPTQDVNPEPKVKPRPVVQKPQPVPSIPQTPRPVQQRPSQPLR